MVQLWRTSSHHLLDWTFSVYPSFLSVFQDANLMGHIRAFPGLLEVKRCHHQAAEDMKRAGCVLLVACFQVRCLGLQNSKSSQLPFSHSYFFWLWYFMSLSLQATTWKCCPIAAQHEALHPSLLGSYKTLLCLCRLFTTQFGYAYLLGMFQEFILYIEQHIYWMICQTL